MEEGQQPDFIVELEIDGKLLECTELNTFIIHYSKPPYADFNFRHIEHYWPDGRVSVIWDSINEQSYLERWGWNPIIHDIPPEEILETYFTHQNSLIDKERKEYLGDQDE